MFCGGSASGDCFVLRYPPLPCRPPKPDMLALATRQRHTYMDLRRSSQLSSALTKIFRCALAALVQDAATADQQSLHDITQAMEDR